MWMSSIWIYCKENCSGSIASLTLVHVTELALASRQVWNICCQSLRKKSLMLAPPGEDKSTISLHLPGWPFLGITPKLMMCRGCRGGEAKGPATLPWETLLARYLTTTLAYIKDEGLFRLADLSLVLWLRPRWKPWCKPSTTLTTLPSSGWFVNSVTNCSTHKGLTSSTGERLAKLEGETTKKDRQQFGQTTDDWMRF